MPTTKISSKSQIVIPAEVRRKLGLRSGDVLHVEVEGERVVLTKQNRDSALQRLERFRGEHWKGAADALQRDRDAWKSRA